jgi:hypothetical protein
MMARTTRRQYVCPQRYSMGGAEVYKVARAEMPGGWQIYFSTSSLCIHICIHSYSIVPTSTADKQGIDWLID